MPRRKRTHVSLLEVCSARAAEVEPRTLRAAKLAGVTAAYVQEWSAYMGARPGVEWTVTGYAEWACVSIRTAFYRQEAFHRLFPEHPNPTPLASLLRDRALPTAALAS